MRCILLMRNDYFREHSILGTTDVPPPTEVDPTQIADGSCGLRLVRVRGRVVDAFRDGIDPMTFLKSSIKALVFGWIITLIACNKGLNAHGGAEAVGKATTSSVVASICCIVLADTLFAFIFY